MLSMRSMSVEAGVLMGSGARNARRSVRAVALGFVALSMVVSGATVAGAANDKPKFEELNLLQSGAISSTTASFPNQVEGAKAAAAAILKKDGVKINITACNDGFDPNLAAACARQAVTDKVHAVIGGTSGNSANLYPTLEAAKIPYFGASPQVDADYQSPIAFPFEPGIPNAALAQATIAKEKGCKKYGILASDQASGQALADTLIEGMEQFKLEGFKVTVPLTAADYAPFVAQVLDEDPDCMGTTLPRVGVALLAIRQSTNPTIPVITGAGFMSKALRGALGTAVEGATGTSQNINNEDPSLTKFHAEMAAYNSDPSIVDDSALKGWANVYAAYQAAKNVKGELTSAKLLAAANKTTFDLEAYPQPIDFSAKPAVKSLPRLHNYNVTVYEIQNGQVTPIDTVDVSKLAKQILAK